MDPAFIFHVSPSSGVPIYRQIIDQVLNLVAGGRLKPDEFLPSIRQVAEGLQVNPMTVSKAYSLMERDGTIEFVRGKGMRVSNRQSRGTLRERQDEMASLLKQVAATAYNLDLTREQTIELLNKIWGTEKK